MEIRERRWSILQVSVTGEVDGDEKFEGDRRWSCRLHGGGRHRCGGVVCDGVFRVVVALEVEDYRRCVRVAGNGG
ncbi:hypothetical protein HanRHA438_Chr01g0038441 [Helianthus annuus]|nr:hypothetical protein HanRHA438_Chr01g0038441 [Helianthus annuus]